MTKSMLLFPAGRFFRQQKVCHGNETKCFGIRNSSFIQTKKYFSDSSTQNKKNIFEFLDSNKKKKKIFKFLDPKKKKLFSDSPTHKKKNMFRFQQSKQDILMTKSL